MIEASIDASPVRSAAVLGGRGLLGTEVVDQLAREGLRVVSLDCAPAPEAGSSHARVQEIQADVLDEDWWPAIADCDVLINLVGTGDHAGSQQRPRKDLRENCATAIAALEAARAIGIRRVCYASTRQVYGIPAALPVNEQEPPRPIDVNGVHRYAAELYHGVYARQFGISYAILRFTNVYGPGLRPGAPMFLARWLDCANRGEPFEVWGGTQTRDLLYVDDAARALVAAVPHCSSTGTVLNCGGPEAATLLAIAAKLGELGLEYRVVPYPADREPIEIGAFVSDSTRLSSLTGWKPRITLDEGLRRTVQAAASSQRAESV